MKLLRVSLLALLTTNVAAQVAHDGTAQVSGNGVTDALTLSSKTTSGSNRIGIVCSVADDNIVTGVTWDGVAMTLAGTAHAGGDAPAAKLFYIINPPTASSNVVISTSAPITQIGLAASFNGAHQTTQDGSAASATGTTSSPATVNVSSAANEMVVDCLYYEGSGTPPSVGASQTSLGTPDNGGYFSGASYEAGAGTVTMSWTVTTPSGWATVGWPIKPVGGGGATNPPRATHYKKLMGNVLPFERRIPKQPAVRELMPFTERLAA